MGYDQSLSFVVVPPPIDIITVVIVVAVLVFDWRELCF